MGGNDTDQGGIRRGALVVGTDGSPTATKAVEAAARLAAAQGQELVVANGYRPVSPATLAHRWQDVPEADRWRVSPGAAGEEVVQLAMAHVRGVLGEELRLRGRCEPGDPAKVLLAVADEVDAAAVVVGNVGLAGWSAHWSVPHRVAKRCRRQVLVVDTVAWAERGQALAAPAPLVLRRAD
jgi:nucleotide-binding universal stress UspA family protein